MTVVLLSISINLFLIDYLSTIESNIPIDSVLGVSLEPGDLLTGDVVAVGPMTSCKSLLMVDPCVSSIPNVELVYYLSLCYLNYMYAAD